MPGQERYSTITPMYLRGSQLAILLCDVTEDESIYEITRFLEQLVHSSPPFKGSHYENSHFANNDYEKLSCKPIFILNKCDLATDEQIDKQERLLKKVIRETINISDIDLYIIKACCANGIGVYSPASADLDGPLPGDELSLVDVMNSILHSLAQDGQLISQLLHAQKTGQVSGRQNILQYKSEEEQGGCC